MVAPQGAPSKVSTLVWVVDYDGGSAATVRFSPNDLESKSQQAALEARILESLRSKGYGA